MLLRASEIPWEDLFFVYSTDRRLQREVQARRPRRGRVSPLLRRGAGRGLRKEVIAWPGR